jgi:competence protein ComGC
MNTDINLLLHTNEETLRKNKNTKIFNLIAAVFLIGVCLISVSIFIMISAANAESESIRKKQEDVLKKMSKFQDRQVKLFILSDRVENIDKLLQTRRNFYKISNGLLMKVPSDLSVDGFAINDNSVIISGQSNSLLTISEFINNLTDMARKKEIIKSLTLSSLVLDDSNNAYVITVNSQL